eukprot:TRINITY_DN12034_c0_g1_i1.p1 TRINITY_DN12034_c0_g1~~TRINITY_DN12034_c0_g1_i1.p1  ORF type:complete len:117 (-),score=11.26 TRINITY_DN12034_c0_g1_i1:123-443(-)
MSYQASFYNKQSVRPYPDGRYLTASGEEFDEKATTAATLDQSVVKFKSNVTVKNPSTNKSVQVYVNDKGAPHGNSGNSKRVIDLTPAAFEKLGVSLSQGTQMVDIQ